MQQMQNKKQTQKTWNFLSFKPWNETLVDVLHITAKLNTKDADIMYCSAEKNWHDVSLVTELPLFAIITTNKIKESTGTRLTHKSSFAS